MIKENQKYLNRLLVVLDILSLILSLIISWNIRFKSGWIFVEGGYLSIYEYMLPLILLIPFYLLIYNLNGLYNPQRKRNFIDELVIIVKSNIIGLVLMIFIIYFIKLIDYSRTLIVIFSCISILLTTFERLFIRVILRIIRKNGYNLKHVLLIGYGKLAEELITRLENNKHWGYNIVGIIDDNKKLGYKFKGKEVVGRINELENILNKLFLDEVFITLNLKEYDKLGQIVNICEKSGVRTQIIPDYYRIIPAKPYVEEVDGLPIINIRHVPLDNVFYRFLKRSMDILGSIAAIILFLPVFIIIPIGIKLTSPGPIIFKQERVGLNRKNFIMYKFRTMHVQKENEEKVKWTTKEDPRKTKLGSFLRRTSLDELPQLFNVFKGDMSLVGPRPERPYFVEKFKEEIPKYMIKHQVRPGMTGWAQVNGLRGDTSIEKRIEYDLYYIENWNLALDVKILFLTVFKGFVSENAY